MIRRIIKSALLNTPLEKPARVIVRAIRGNDTVTARAQFNPQTFRAFDLPKGMTEDSLREVMLSFQIDDGAKGELDPYVYDALFAFFTPGVLSKMKRANV